MGEVLRSGEQIGLGLDPKKPNLNNKAKGALALVLSVGALGGGYAVLKGGEAENTTVPSENTPGLTESIGVQNKVTTESDASLQEVDQIACERLVEEVGGSIEDCYK